MTIPFACVRCCIYFTSIQELTCLAPMGRFPVAPTGAGHCNSDTGESVQIEHYGTMSPIGSALRHTVGTTSRACRHSRRVLCGRRTNQLDPCSIRNERRIVRAVIPLPARPTSMARELLSFGM